MLVVEVAASAVVRGFGADVVVVAVAGRASAAAVADNTSCGGSEVGYTPMYQPPYAAAWIHNAPAHRTVRPADRTVLRPQVRHPPSHKPAGA